MTSAEKYIKTRLAGRQNEGAYRTLRPETGLIDFCSNDYLGFAHSAKLKALIASEIENNDALNGSTGSRLISGNLAYTEGLEQQLADIFNSGAGLLFNSGYDANVGLLSSLPQRGDTVITDELIHASVIDGVRLSHANRYTFKHNDLESLEGKLQNAKGVVYVVIESIYSMDGDTPPLAQIFELTERYYANLIVDEAHAVGLYKTGIVASLGLEHKVFARVVTFGKALGAHGAIVLGSDMLRQYLINFARSFIYTTAAPFHQLAAIKVSCDYLQKADLEIEKLQTNINLFKQQVSADTLIESSSAIQCVLLNSNEKAKAAAASLQQAGFDVRAILSPTVAAGSERIRICLHAFNTTEQIKALANHINTIIHA